MITQVSRNVMADDKKKAMGVWRSRLSAGWGAALYMTLALAPAYASDVEVYARQPEIVSNDPTLFFMVDTSGSMGACLEENDDDTCRLTRIQGLKQGLLDALQGTNGATAIPGNVKVGLGHYYDASGDDDYQGKVVREVRRLDELVSGPSVNDSESKRVARAADDFTALGSASSGDSSNALKLFVNGQAVKTVMRIADVRLPAGATINRATLTVKVKGINGSGSYYPGLLNSTATVGLYNSNSLTLSCSGNTCSLPSVSTLASTSQTINDDDFANSQEFTFDLTSALRGLYGGADWSAGKSLGLVLSNNGSASSISETHQECTGRGRRRVCTWVTTTTAPPDSIDLYHGGDGTSAPALTIDYTSVSTVSWRSKLVETVQGLSAESYTPIIAAYGEAGRYMMGSAPFSNSTLSNHSVASSKTADGSRYLSPVPLNDQCSANYIYLLTDGQPTRDAYADEVIVPALASGQSCSSTNSDPWDCANKLASRLNNSGNQRGTKVFTSVVGYGADVTNYASRLQAIATAGGGRYFPVLNSQQMAESLRKTVNDLLTRNATISGAGMAVNQLNRLSNLDEVYYGVFEPVFGDPTWKGNLKKFYLDYTNGRVLNKDKSTAAVDSKGRFTDDSWSEWSDAKDGKSATAGGAAAELTAPSTRKLFTDLAYNGTPTRVAAGGDLKLVSSALVNADFLTGGTAKMGASSQAVFKNVMNWMRGFQIAPVDGSEVDVSTNPPAARPGMGGALHSRPVMVNYGYVGSTAADLAAATTDPTKQKNVIYVSTMEGLLHAVNANTGAELFSFLPMDLFPDAQDVASNTASADYLYGLDSTWTVWRNDASGNYKIAAGEKSPLVDQNPSDTNYSNYIYKDFVYLYGGMRMGGSNYYALDVTTAIDATPAPKLLWVITPSSHVAFTKMGQSWSQPVRATVKINNKTRHVLFFGGGYDPVYEDDSATLSTGQKGAQVYAVDAKTGELLWWATNSTNDANCTADNKCTAASELGYSVPSDLKIADFNGDGFVDAVYFGDLAGQLFRVDINNNHTENALKVKRVRRIANLGRLGSGATAAADRRFYEAPSVAVLRDSTAGSKPYVVVAIGSGNRSHPLSEAVTDRLYMLRDDDALRGDLLSDLESRTTNGLATVITDSTTQLAELDPSSQGTSGLTLRDASNAWTKRGWYVKLADATTDVGEKVLASPVIFNNEVLFTTYVPSDLATGVSATADACSPVNGRARLWLMSAADGGRVDLSTALGVTTPTNDRYVDDVIDGLPPEAQIAINNRDTVVLVSTRALNGRRVSGATLKRAHWYEKSPNQ